MENQIIDVAIGLALAFMVVSVLVSGIQEFLAGLMDSRSVQLEKGIKCLLFGSTDPDKPDEIKFITELFSHPLLFNLSKGKRLPSYLPANNFAWAVVEVARSRLQQAGHTSESVRDISSAVDSTAWKQLLSPLAAEAGGDIKRLRLELELQFEQMMDRVSGWYKRRAQWFMLLYGFFLAVTLNVDALEMTSRFWTDSVMRAAVVASATDLEKRTNGDPQKMEKELQALKELQNLPVGWPTRWADDKSGSSDNEPKYFMFSLIGWFITALAASLGAPFWFDAIGKLVSLKGAGKIPERSSKTKGGAASSAKTTSTLHESADDRNAIVDLYAARHKEDESYRPVQVEELW